jgi:uncharacterized protein YegP (UPF0339 family)
MNSLANNNFKIINRFLILVMAFAFSCDDIFVNDISTSIVQLKAPSSGWQGNDTGVSFRWEEVPDADNYQLEIVTPGFSVDHRLVFDTLLEVAKFDTSLTGGVYEWRIKALNSSSATAYSTSSFTILNPLNIASKQVSLKLPEDQYVGIMRDVYFSWEALDEASFYSFKIKKTNWVGDSVVVTKLYSPNFTFRLEDGVYAWGVAAIDTLTNTTTDYSIRSITIDKNPPPVPVIVTPANRDTLNSLVVVFNWRKTEPDAKYSIEIYSDPELKNRVIEKTLPDTITYISMERSGYYFWKVKSIDQYENSSNYTAVSAFCVQLPTNILPIVVSLTSPADKSSLIDKNVKFWWTNVSGAEKYNLQVVSPSFANPQKLITDQWITTNSFALELEPGNYQWRVKAANNISETCYSIISSLSIYNNDLTKQKITLLKPLYAEQINAPTVKLSWEKINSNANYYLLVKKDSWETGTIIQEMNTAKTDIELTFSDGEYFWGIKAVDPLNNSETEYSIRKFVVDLKKDLSGTNVSLLSPTDKSTVVDKKVTFWWNLLTGAEKYNLQIATPSFTNPVKLISDQWITTNLVTIDLEAGNYEWRVKAANSVSETGYSQSSLSIYNNDLTKQKITLLKPLYAEQINAPTVKLSWEKINSNANYHLLVRKDSWETGTIVQEMNTAKTDIELTFSDGEYFWGIKAVDPLNNSETDYSIRKFGVNLKGDLVGTKVSLLSPADKSTVVDKKVTFWWNSLTGAEKYNLQVVSPSFDNPLKLITDQWVTTNSVVMQLEAGNYEWRVKAANSNSETGYSRFSLSIYNNDLTTQKTTLLTPLYAEIVNRSLLKLSWELINNNANYHLLIKKDSWESGTIVQEMNTTKAEIELSFLDGEYYWGVKAIDPQNNSETAYSTRKFVIDLIAPEIPKLNSPANNLITLDYLINFSWEPADVADTKLTYTLEMYKIISNVANQMASKTTQLKTVGYNFESVGKYKWRIYATDNAGNRSAFSEYRYFEIQ